MSEASKTLGNKLNDAWENLTQPHRPGPEVGADLQAQAAAYDYAVSEECNDDSVNIQLILVRLPICLPTVPLQNAAPTAEEAARNAADLAAAKTDVAHEEAVSGLRGTGERELNHVTGGISQW